MSVSTSVLASNGTGVVSGTGFKTYALLSVRTSSAAWVRIYSSVAARTADAARTIGQDPLPGSGVIAEVITNGAETQLITPAAIGFSSENAPTTAIPMAITNTSNVSVSITATLSVVQLEA